MYNDLTSGYMLKDNLNKHLSNIFFFFGSRKSKLWQIDCSYNADIFGQAMEKVTLVYGGKMSDLTILLGKMWWIIDKVP